MYKDVKLRITGMTPLMLHNAALVDGRNPIVIAIKEHTSKSAKTKTSIDDIAIEHLEWLGSLYTTEDGTFKRLPSGALQLTGYGQVCFQGQMIEGMMAGTAGQVPGVTKDGCIASIISDGNWPLILDGPSDVLKIYANKEQFTDRRSVKVNQARVMRTRPRFNSWAAEFVVSYRDDMMDEKKVREIIAKAGDKKGIGDYRPKFGLFKLEE